MPWLCCHVNPKTKREDCYKVRLCRVSHYMVDALAAAAQVADQHDELPPADDGQKQNMFSWERRAQMDIEKFRIHDVDGDTVVRRGVAGQPMIIETCKDTNIIVLDHTSTITVDDCTGCLIVLGPCAGSFSYIHRPQWYSSISRVPSAVASGFLLYEYRGTLNASMLLPILEISSL
uniref:CARP domain-containing protein n=1 Tax=Angiostrongylus cantonensis TaxID=6313 RepID=A0A158P962_ANGCA